MLIIAVGVKYLHVCIFFFTYWDDQCALFQYVITHYIILYDIRI